MLKLNKTNTNTERFCFKSILEIKEQDIGLIVKGYIATTHFDGQDIITKLTLDKWEKEINDGIPRSNKVSVNHDRTPHVAGVGLKGSAKVDLLPDGEFGLYVETLIDKTRDDYNELKYRIENDFLDSFSIEYVAATESKYDEDIGARILGTDTELHGWTLASQPMNEHAVMIKELLNQDKEVTTMTDNKIEVQDVEAKEEEVIAEPVKEEAKAEPVEEAKEEEESKPEAKPEAEPESKEEAKPEEKKEVEVKMNDVIEIKESIKEFKEDLKNLKVEAKTKMNTDNDVQETIESKEYKDALKSKSLNAQFAAAGKLADSLDLHYSGKETSAERKEFKSFSTDGAKLEFKALGLDTNSTTYTESVAELSDVYDPVIYNVLNQKTVAFNIINKDDKSGKGNNLVQFTVKSVANPTAAAYTGNAVSIGNVTREKNQTKFKKYQVGVEVDGDMIAAARGGPIGDVFSQEVADSTDDLMAVMNADIFTEKGAEADAEIIGLPYLSDAAGNTALYGLTRSSFTYMAGNSGATYINASSADISIKLLRQARRQAVAAGSNVEDLVFFCDWSQNDKFLGIYDAIQRVAPTSSRFGFEGRPSTDGIPIFADKDCKAQSWFLVDLKDGYRFAMWVPPTLEMLGKDADSKKGFIKTYFAAYSRRPNSVVEIYGAAQ